MYSSIDPAQVLFLMCITLVHLIYMFLFILPHVEPLTNLSRIAMLIKLFDDKKIYLLIEYFLLSIGVLIVLLNLIIHSRIVDLELERRRVYSFCKRLSTVFVFSIGNINC